MKSFIVFIFIVSTSINCGEKLAQSRTGEEFGSKNSNLSTPVEVNCTVENYKPKFEAELSAMPPRRLIDELIQENPNSFDSYSAWADHTDLIEGLIRKEGVKALPVISEYIDSYDHKNRSECSELRFAVVSRLASDVDRFNFRLRGTKEGQIVIDSLQKALQQIVNSEPGISFATGSKGRHQPGAFMSLKELKGINHVDTNIADTLWVRYKIELSENEIEEFANFLISRDPKYPSWSTSKLIKDFSRINDAVNPRQVYVFDNPKPFHDAYIDFKRSKKK